MRKTILTLLLSIVLVSLYAQKHHKKKIYYDTGELKAIGKNKEAKNTISWISYDKAGNAISEKQYNLDGKFDGEWKSFYPNGQIEKIGHYSNGDKVAQWQTFGKNGEIDGIFYFSTDDFLSRVSCSLLDYVKRCEIKESRHKWRYYYANNTLASKGKFLQGYKSKKWKSYYENGKLKEVGKYIKGRKVGEWKYFHENGKKYRRLNYIEGSRNGIARIYYKSGALKSYGVYTDGKQDEGWKEYDEQGNIVNDKSEYTNFYITNTKGDTIVGSTIGDTINLVIETKNMVGETAKIDLSDDEDNTYWIYKGIKIFNIALDDIIIEADITKLKLLAGGRIYNLFKELEEDFEF